jgi:hypothetical protein
MMKIIHFNHRKQIAPEVVLKAVLAIWAFFGDFLEQNTATSRPTTDGKQVE